MDYERIIEATIAAVIVSNLTDWLFFGVLFHKYYSAFPEVWRNLTNDKRTESKLVLQSASVGVLTPGLFILGCAYFGIVTWQSINVAAVGVWTMMVVPHLFSNYLFMKLHLLTTIAHALGWLARLMVAGLSVKIFLG